MEKKDYQKERRAKFEELGLCIGCGKTSPRQGLKTCQKCGEKRCAAMKKWQEKTHAKRKQMGLCHCGKETAVGFNVCENCRNRNYQNYVKRKEKGLCNYCGNKATRSTTRCEECASRKKAECKLLKLEVFEAYGGVKCACCGEHNECFLSIDHINGDGNKHRREIGRTSLYNWLRHNGYPEGFQVLCFNCNHGRHINGGICPHKQSKDI